VTAALIAAAAAFAGAWALARWRTGRLARDLRRADAERERAVVALRQSEQRFRLAFKTSPEPMTLSRLQDGILVAVNDGFCLLHGVTEEQALGHRSTDLGIWADPAERAAIVAETSRGEVVRAREVHVRGRDGSIRVHAFSASRVDLPEGPHVLALSRDVTDERAAAAERARLDAALQRSQDRIREVLRSLPVVQFALDRTGVFTLSEGRALQAVGLVPGQVVGQRLDVVYRDQPGFGPAFERALAGETVTTFNKFGPAEFETYWAPIRDAAGAITGVTGIALDVTDRNRAELARKDSEIKVGMLERLAAVGRVAAGVAHEINNPLTYVLGNLETAIERLPDDGGNPEVVQLLREAQTGGERVRDIVRDLRMFARARQEPSQACDVAAVVRSATAIARNEIRHRARLVVAVEATPPAAIAEGRLAQVLVNLLSNAAQAIPEGNAAENEIRVAGRTQGGEVILEVSDTGRGMSPEVQARLFEPFFTTRQTGEGMGLGLALSHAMVAEAGGRIEVESAPERGTTFRVRLPIAVRRSPARPSHADGAPARRLRVLIVDDEPLVARAVARVLATHEVEVVGSAAAALTRLRAGERFDVIVCDLLMPDVTGMDLHGALATERPDLADRLMFLTGGAFTDRAREFVDRVGARVLEKPVDAKALRTAVAQVAADAARRWQGGGVATSA
jgi:PAS domain S-box-containing protein